MNLVDLRREYHRQVFEKIIRISYSKNMEYPNFSDSGNTASVKIASGIVRILGHEIGSDVVKGQTSGGRFEEITKDFIEESFDLLQHLRPGKWHYYTHSPISKFNQYSHLHDLEEKIKKDKELASSLGRDYIITPDIVVSRELISDDDINKHEILIAPQDVIAQHTPFRKENSQIHRLMLHASISCKWTIRSDRSQNARTEAINLIRNRKGHIPHIVAVTAEPLPTRLASLALGTGDLDCVYHFALGELQEAIQLIKNEDQLDMLNVLVEGKRLRDISDLPFDLAV